MLGEPLGFIAEEPRGLLSTFSRQILRTHRPFRAVILDLQGTPVLWVTACHHIPPFHRTEIVGFDSYGGPSLGLTLVCSYSG